MTTTDMSKAFAEARARGEAALLREEIETLRTRAEAAEAEVARLRAQADDVSIHAAGRLVREAREAALREAAGVCRSFADECVSDELFYQMGEADAEKRRFARRILLRGAEKINALLDAAPAAEVSDG